MRASGLDCFVAALLAMTVEGEAFFLPSSRTRSGVPLPLTCKEEEEVGSRIKPGMTAVLMATTLWLAPRPKRFHKSG